MLYSLNMHVHKLVVISLILILVTIIGLVVTYFLYQQTPEFTVQVTPRDDLSDEVLLSEEHDRDAFVSQQKKILNELTPESEPKPLTQAEQQEQMDLLLQLSQ